MNNKPKQKKTNTFTHLIRRRDAKRKWNTASASQLEGKFFLSGGFWKVQKHTDQQIRACKTVDAKTRVIQAKCVDEINT